MELRCLAGRLAQKDNTEPSRSNSEGVTTMHPASFMKDEELAWTTQECVEATERIARHTSRQFVQQRRNDVRSHDLSKSVGILAVQIETKSFSTAVVLDSRFDLTERVQGDAQKVLLCEGKAFGAKLAVCTAFRVPSIQAAIVHIPDRQTERCQQINDVSRHDLCSFWIEQGSELGKIGMSNRSESKDFVDFRHPRTSRNQRWRQLSVKRSHLRCLPQGVRLELLGVRERQKVVTETTMKRRDRGISQQHAHNQFSMPLRETFRQPQSVGRRTGLLESIPLNVTIDSGEIGIAKTLGYVCHHQSVIEHGRQGCAIRNVSLSHSLSVQLAYSGCQATDRKRANARGLSELGGKYAWILHPDAMQDLLSDSTITTSFERGAPRDLDEQAEFFKTGDLAA